MWSRWYVWLPLCCTGASQHSGTCRRKPCAGHWPIPRGPWDSHHCLCVAWNAVLETHFWRKNVTELNFHGLLLTVVSILFLLKSIVSAMDTDSAWRCFHRWKRHNSRPAPSLLRNGICQSARGCGTNSSRTVKGSGLTDILVLPWWRTVSG
jgi:hypothetical protein